MNEIKFGQLKVEKEVKFGKLKVDVIKIGEIEDLTNELTEQDTLLTTQKIIIEQIIEALQEKISGNTSTTIEEIEQLIVSYFENKTVKEVES